MRELQQRQKVKKKLYSIPVLGILALFTIFILRGTFLVMKKQHTSAQAVDELQAKVAGLATRQTELRADIDRLATDEGIDAEIKERFSVSRPGEHVVVIVDPEVISTSTVPVKIPWYKKLLEAIKSL
jgi:cell division protein FtsB